MKIQKNAPTVFSAATVSAEIAKTVLIDAGNTRIKFAVLLSPSRLDLSDGFRVFGQCDTNASVAEIVYLLQNELGLSSTPESHAAALVAQTPVKIRACGVCVAGTPVAQRINEALRTLDADAQINWLNGMTPLTGLGNAYATPETLGADRWLAAYGLSKVAGEHACVLATFGTATTIDLLHWDTVNKRHVFAGGLIIAGLHTALRSVSTSTAQLPDLHTADLQKTIAGIAGSHKQDASSEQGAFVVPNNTQDALLIGALLSQAGAVLRFEALVSQNEREIRTFIAGGAAPLMKDLIPNAQLLKYPVFVGLSHFSFA